MNKDSPYIFNWLQNIYQYIFSVSFSCFTCIFFSFVLYILLPIWFIQISVYNFCVCLTNMINRFDYSNSTDAKKISILVKTLILFLVEKSPVNINCLFACLLDWLLVCPQGQKNIKNQFWGKDISRGNSMRRVRIWCWF